MNEESSDKQRFSRGRRPGVKHQRLRAKNESERSAPKAAA